MTKISELTAAGAITGAEQVPIVQGGTTKRTTVAALNGAAAPTAAGEIATYQTNAMWGTCFGQLTQTGLTCADGGSAGFNPAPAFTGDADVFALGTHWDTPSLSILLPGWYHVMAYAHQWSPMPTTGHVAIYPECDTDNSAFGQGGFWVSLPGEILAASNQLQCDAVIWVPTDDVPFTVTPWVWQKTGASRTFSLWCGAWPILIDET